MEREARDGRMVVKLYHMTADPGTAAIEMAKAGGSPDRLATGWLYKTDEPMLDGPVNRRVAVIDFDPETGAVLPGARFEPPTPSRTQGRYAIEDRRNIHAADFRQVSVFTTVLRTMAMFEEPDVLGRRIRWAFDGEQLLVVPRAGRMENAFYHRESRSLQFFFFDAEIDGRTVEIQTCLSPDIVAHESAHAILDGIAPDLYDSVSPQSLGLHEAIADLAAVLSALRTRDLVMRQLELAGGDLTKALAFARIAEQFGQARTAGRVASLRDLLDNASLSPDFGKRIDEAEPHALSTVVSGALYSLLLDMHKRQQIVLSAKASPGPAGSETSVPYSVSGAALYSARQRLKRLALRALDYLPPAEVSFADYGRAIIAADLASNPEASPERDFIAAEFQKRGIVDQIGELMPIAPGFALPDDFDLDALVRSDWAAFQFAEAHRNVLMIPSGIPFEVRPRLDVAKRTFRSGQGLGEGQTDGAAREADYREVIFKVSWLETESVAGYGDLFETISVAFGTTIAIDRDTRTVKALLTTSREHASQKHGATQRNAEMREIHLALCLDEGIVAIGEPGVELSGKTLNVSGLAQYLHIGGR